MTAELWTCPRRPGTMWQVFNFVHDADYWHEVLWTPGFGKWTSQQKPPRTCSHCGGVHPEDAITLVAAGWTVESTYKLYRKVLHPPPPHADPVPLVKVMLQHFSLDEREQFNEVLRAQVHDG